MTVYKPNPDWRSAAEHLRAEATTSGGPIVVFSRTPARELKYYAGFTLHDIERPRGRAADDEASASLMEALASSLDGSVRPRWPASSAR